jgi:predicted nucleic acid-binding protein
MRLEVGNALLKAMRRGVIDSADAAAAFARLTAPSIRFEQAGPSAEHAFELAERHGGSVYDAVYIALAKTLGGVVATNDTELADTSRSAGVQAWLLSEPPPPELRSS